MLPNAQAPFDEKVWVMKLTPERRARPAVVFSYACHPVIVYGYAYSAISADFPGATRNLLRESLGPKAHFQFVQGFAGDIRPRVLADLDKRPFPQVATGGFGAGGQGPGRRGADRAEVPRRKRFHWTLRAPRTGHILPRGKPPPTGGVTKRCGRAALANTNAFRLGVSDYWLKHYDSGEGFARGDAWSLGLIRLAGNQWIVHSGGEPCIEWRAKIAQWLALLNIVDLGLLPGGERLSADGSDAAGRRLRGAGFELRPREHARALRARHRAAVRESLLRQLAFIRAKVD